MKYSKWFGASHLLRFLIAIIPCFSNANTSSTGTSTANTSTSTNIEKATVSTVSSGRSYRATTTDTDTENTKDTERISTRQNKLTEKTLQNIVDAIILELKTNIQIYF
jgi:hypothetical protein